MVQILIQFNANADLPDAGLLKDPVPNHMDYIAMLQLVRVEIFQHAVKQKVIYLMLLVVYVVLQNVNLRQDIIVMLLIVQVRVVIFRYVLIQMVVHLMYQMHQDVNVVLQNARLVLDFIAMNR